MPIPQVWEKYRADWNEQDMAFDDMLPQILIGSDKAVLHPRAVLGDDNLPVETATARLLKSVVLGKYLAHGFEEPVNNIQMCDEDEPADVDQSTHGQTSQSTEDIGNQILEITQLFPRLV